VRCNTILVALCQGTLWVSLVDPAAAVSRTRRTARPGFVRYSIAATTERTIKVALDRSDTRAIKQLSRKRLAHRRLELQATIELGTTMFQQTSLRVVRRKR
jgi:hypothetical protein